MREPGNRLYLGHQDPADPTHFFYERYASQPSKRTAHPIYFRYTNLKIAVG